MNKYIGELHVHSVLSPCASLEMGPCLILSKAKEKGLNFLAITDHNTTKNLRAFQQAAKEHEIHLLYGIEVETNEEIHLLCYFDQIDKAERLGELIYNSLLPIANDVNIFGDQIIIDSVENIVGVEDRLLLQRSSYSLEKVCELVNVLGGLAIPAHVDRRKNGLFSTLGFLPEQPVFHYLEVSSKCNIVELKKSKALNNLVCFKGCDAHQLNEIGNNPLVFELNELTIKEIIMAFNGEENRKWFQY